MTSSSWLMLWLDEYQDGKEACSIWQVEQTLVRSTLSAIHVHLSIVIGLLVCRPKELGGLGVLDLRRAVVAFGPVIGKTFAIHF